VRLALTGPEDGPGGLGSRLRERGVDVLPMPLLEATPPPDPGPLRRAARALRTFGLVAFPSPRGVEALAGALASEGVVDRHVEAIAVGRETALRAEAAGFLVVVDGSGNERPGAEGLLGAVDAASYPVRGVRVLLPRSRRGLPDLEEGLRARGAGVEAVEAYDVVAVPDPGVRLAGWLRSKGLPGWDPAPVLVASPSAAEALAAGLAECGAEGGPRIALGPTTAKALRALGIPAHRVAGSPTVEGILAALASVPGGIA